MRRNLAAVIALALCGCLPTSQARWAGGPPREAVDSLWELAPRDASDGVVVHPGGFARALELTRALKTHPTPHPKKKEIPEKEPIPPLATVEDWERAGLDPALDGAAFSWADPERGALFVLPLKDRASFRAAFQARTRVEAGREIDEVIQGYSCVTVAERLVCAKSVADIDGAAAAHSSPVAFGGEHLGPDDTGDIEIFATPAAPHIADMAVDAKDYGKLKSVATSVRFRDDGASLRIHAMGEMVSPEARSLAGSPPSSDHPIAVGAPTVLRVHIDPVLASANDKDMEPEDRHELVEQLTGDAEVTTSGRGLIGVYASLGVKDAARVQAYVRKKCADAGGLGTGLRGATVTDHGCTAIFDTKMALMPVFLDPIPVSAEVLGDKLVVTVGGGRAPTPQERTASVVIPETDAAFALADTEAIVAFTKSPWIGQDIGAGAAFRKLFWMVGEDASARIDGFNDMAAHVAQAYVAARVADDGAVMQAGFVTFARDPPEVLAAYEEALGSRAAGDVKTYQAQLADIERRFPKSLAAQRAAELRASGPFLGAGAVSLGSVGIWLQALESVMHLAPFKSRH